MEAHSPQTGGRKKNDMDHKLVVDGLSWDTTSAELHTAFSSYGDVVEVRIVTNHDTGRSRGVGFVTFQDERVAAHAVEELNGTVLDGKTIRVDLAKNRRRDNRRSLGRW